MIWDKLIDRCLLFTDSPGGLIKELLKEAEIELANRLELYESLYRLEVPASVYGMGLHAHNSSREHNYHKLPSNYLRDISVTHNGSKLRKMSEDEINRQSTGQSYSGTPTAYGIAGDYIVFNSTPTAGDVFVIFYKSQMDALTDLKVLTMFYYLSSGPYVWLDTDLGANLELKKIYYEQQSKTLEASSASNASLTNSPGLPDTVASNMPGNPTIIAGLPLTSGTRYTLNSTFTSANSLADDVLDGAGGLVQIANYRNIAPLIPDRFHINLCDYAIALANAKVSTDIYDKYWMKWELNMQRLDNEARDRDLIYSVREEI